MAGHSKWANIQHRKKAQDAKKGKIFTKLIREITVSARMGGPDADNNSRLRSAIHTALSHNMSKETIERAIKKGIGDEEGQALEEITYEGYGPGGIAVVVECMTDNRNRTVSEVRHAFTKCGGNLGTDGSVVFLFKTCGLFIFAPNSSEEQIMELALEYGADDIINNEDGSIEVISSPERFHELKDIFEVKNVRPIQAQVTRIAATEIEPTPEIAEKIIKLIDMLDELDDVQNIYHNAIIAQEYYE